MSSSSSTQKGNFVQIFIESPDLGIPTRSLTLNPKTTTTTLLNLKHSLFPTQTLITNSLYFTLNGKPLLDSSEITILPFSTLTLRIRALGGGGDGGSTCAESRDCYLNMYAVKKPDKVDPNEARLSKWTNCALSNEPLNPPCVVDKLGNVFNKEPLVEALLGKKLPKEFGGHIKGLKDMIPIQLEGFMCPITGLEFNGKYRFYALKGCGHVLSAKAFKELAFKNECLVCHGEFEDKIPINGSVEEVTVLREKMEAERAAVREKKSGKAANGVEGGVVSWLSGTKHGADEEKVFDKKSEVVNGKVTNAGVVDVKVVGKNNGSVKRLKSGVVAPANATKEVYESIFTSSKKSELRETYMCRSLPLGRN